MAFEPFAFTKSWTDPQAFPTYESDETQVRADLQCLHDELRDGLNRLIDGLNDPETAGQLPFLPQDGLTAETVQEAVLEVYGQIKNAAAGLLVDGSVTKEKLAQALLDRIYGGRVLVSAETPDDSRNPDSDYPLGQLWLRPAYSLTNLTGEDWQTAGCTMEAGSNGWTLSCDGSAALITASQSLEAVGQAGQQILVYLQALTTDERMSALSLWINGVEYDLLDGSCLFESALDQSGSLELQVVGQWPYAVDDGVVTLSHMGAVNVQALEEALPGVAMPEDWTAFLQARLPFAALNVERVLYQQTAPGRWVETDRDVCPVDRGGTGLDQVEQGSLLYGGGEALQTLAPPAEAGALLRYDGGPCWTTAAETAEALAVPKVASGTYTGTGTAGTLTLPVKPKLLYIYPQSGPDTSFWNSWAHIRDNPVVLADGATWFEIWTLTTDTGTSVYSPMVALSGDVLTFSVKAKASGGYARLCNRSGVTYGWTAIC